MAEEKNEKSRSWTIVVYPESAPRNWREVLDDSHIRWVESPLHNMDANPDGERKKEHWHILLLFDGPVTFRNVSNLCKRLNSPIPQIAKSAKGMVRYMIHLDNPEKYQYKREDIVGHGGVDVDEFFALSTTTRLHVTKEISQYILTNHITLFSDLVKQAITDGNDDWFDVMANHNTLFLNKLIDSEWRKQRNEEN